MTRKRKFILIVLAFVAMILALKEGVDFFNLDIISIGPFFSPLIAGVVFTIAIILGSVLADYKESEKIPGELAASIKSLYKDTRLIQVKDKEIVAEMQSHIKDLLHVINSNFRQNKWKLTKINEATSNIDEDIIRLAKMGVAPQFLVKFRIELTNIEKISNRVEIIIETTFIPIAYTIAQLATAMLLSAFIFLKIEPFYEGIVALGGISFLLISLLLLIKDMDNPFEVDKDSYANVDLKILFKLEEYMKNI